MNHLFVTQDYAPDLGGMARLHVELCRRFGDGDETTMSVSTVASRGAAAFDDHEYYNWDRVARDTREFTDQVVASRTR